jgi:hypothetical protein
MLEYNIKFPPEIKGPSQEAQYLMEDENMKGRYLGQCLDNCRWGSLTTVMWEFSTLQMLEFIKNWMNQNENNLRFHEMELPAGFELPYISHEKCPRDSNHKLKSQGLDGSIRCIEETVKEIREGFVETWISYDDLSRSRRKEYMESGYDLYEEELEEINKSEILRREVGIGRPTVTVKERCGAILSDRGVTLPLAEILDRLNIFYGSRYFCKGDLCKDPLLKEFGLERQCFGHKTQDHFVTPFSGWTLADYVQKWYEQLPKGSAPFTTPQTTKRIMGKIKPF